MIKGGLQKKDEKFYKELNPKRLQKGTNLTPVPKAFLRTFPLHDKSSVETKK